MRVAKREVNAEEAAKQVEAVLFSSGRWMTEDELSRLCRLKDKSVKEALVFLSKKYENSDTALELINDKNKGWKLTVRQKYSETVRKVVPQTELNKSIIETLAVIAWKAPVLQSEVIKIRTNKAYDDIKTLEEEGFITKEKSGRTYLIKLSKKFFSYFEIENREDLNKIIKNIEEKQENKKKEVEIVNDTNSEQKSIVEYEVKEKSNSNSIVEVKEQKKELNKNKNEQDTSLKEENQWKEDNQNSNKQEIRVDNHE